MNPFKKMTRQERSEIWNGCDPTLTHMLGNSEQDFLDAAPSEGAPEVVPARPLTLVEKVALDDALARTTLFGGIYRDREYSSVPAIAALERAEEQNSFAKVFGRQPSVQTPFDEMFSTAWREAVAQFKKRYEREPLIIRSSSAPSTHLGGRVEYDSGANESTEYDAVTGALLRSWIGGPSARPAFENMATR